MTANAVNWAEQVKHAGRVSVYGINFGTGNPRSPTAHVPQLTHTNRWFTITKRHFAAWVRFRLSTGFREPACRRPTSSVLLARGGVATISSCRPPVRWTSVSTLRRLAHVRAVAPIRGDGSATACVVRPRKLAHAVRLEICVGEFFLLTLLYTRECADPELTTHRPPFGRPAARNPTAHGG